MDHGHGHAAGHAAGDYSHHVPYAHYPGPADAAAAAAGGLDLNATLHAGSPTLGSGINGGGAGAHGQGNGAAGGRAAYDQGIGLDLESFAGYAHFTTSPSPAAVHGAATARSDGQGLTGSDLHHRNSTIAHSVFDDTFSEALSFDAAYGAGFDAQAGDAKTPPLDADDGLLKFSPLTFHRQLLDYAYRTAPVTAEATLSGMFFNSLAEAGPAALADDGTLPVRSVTCYRRNLFSVSGTLTLPSGLRSVAGEHGEQIPIVSAEAALTATESLEGAAVKLISVPFKSASMPAGVEDKPDKDPPTVPVDFAAGADGAFISLPIAWKRLQFRSSTANNGRRRELQQNYICRVSLMATLANGQRVSLCDMRSEPIVVRGRSPRAFAAKKEAAMALAHGHGLAGGNAMPTSAPAPGSGSRKPTMHRSATAEGTPRLPPGAGVRADSEFAFDLPDFGMSDPWGLRSSVGPTGPPAAMTALPQESFRLSPHDFFAQSSPDLSRYQRVAVPAPVNLSLTEDDAVRQRPSPVRDSSLGTGARAAAKHPRLAQAGRPHSFSLAGLQHHNSSDGTGIPGADGDDDDALYEYFPLGLDDWSEPVEAVYRPHVVHHIALPAAKLEARAGRSKRYFSDASPS